MFFNQFQNLLIPSFTVWPPGGAYLPRPSRSTLFWSPRGRRQQWRSRSVRMLVQTKWPESDWPGSTLSADEYRQGLLAAAKSALTVWWTRRSRVGLLLHSLVQKTSFGEQLRATTTTVLEVLLLTAEGGMNSERCLIVWRFLSPFFPWKRRHGFLKPKRAGLFSSMLRNPTFVLQHASTE